MPLTQEQIGEALGITPVHANRIIKQLRDENILDINRGRVRVLNETRLAELRNSTTAIFTKARPYDECNEFFFKRRRVTEAAANRLA